MGIDLLPQSVHDRWEVHEYRHACAILKTDFPEEWRDLLYVLDRFRLMRSAIMTAGGNKSPISIAINGLFAERGWEERHFDVNIIVDKEEHHTPTHGIDYYKNKVAIETEWNNKDPFYDRDLTNFRLLFDLRAISVGVIITRAQELRELFRRLKRKLGGASTTQMGKLLPKIESGSVGGCPLLVFGITERLYVDDRPES